MYEGEIIIKGLMLYTGTSLLGVHMAACAEHIKPPAALAPRKVWFREFPLMKVSPIPFLGMMSFSVVGTACTQWLFILFAFPSDLWQFHKYT